MGHFAVKQKLVSVRKGEVRISEVRIGEVRIGEVRICLVFLFIF